MRNAEVNTQRNNDNNRKWLPLGRENIVMRERGTV